MCMYYKYHCSKIYIFTVCGLVAQEGTVDCSCKHCLWSLEGARNPSLALACEWEAAKEVLAYVSVHLQLPQQGS